MERLPTSRTTADERHGRRTVISHFYLLARMDRRVRVNTVVCAGIEHDPTWHRNQSDFHLDFGELCSLEVSSSQLTLPATELLCGHVPDV